MALQLKRQTAKIAHLNVREEKHGEESVLAVDIKLKLDVPNDFLGALAPGLREALYAPEGGQLSGLEVPLTVLRFPQLAPLHWDTPMTGCGLTLHGAKKAQDLEFQADIAKALALEPKEGGTVELTLQVQVRPELDQMAPLTGLLGKSTKASLKPGEAVLETTAPGEDDGDEAAAESGGAAKDKDWPFPRKGK